jgi:pimeloyl-ACP methyl ester carboxylesterase
MRRLLLAGVLASAAGTTLAASDPVPRGRLVSAGQHRIHLDCRGTGGPTTIVETGLGDFSFDWRLVQDRVARTRRICTYDRAGYAWSEPGPKPRTFDQINLELHDALAAAGEHGPFLLVGHSYGGGVVRNYALRYPNEVAGLVLAEAVGDTQWIVMGSEAKQLRTFASGRAVPPARATMSEADRPAAPEHPPEEAREDPALRVLAADVRAMHRWASGLPALEDAENSQRDWSVEYIKRWAEGDQAGRLGDLPLIVLARKDGSYPADLNRPAAELESDRLAAQRALAAWSRHGRLQLVPAGHELHLEAPGVVAAAIEEVAREAVGQPLTAR